MMHAPRTMTWRATAALLAACLLVVLGVAVERSVIRPSRRSPDFDRAHTSAGTATATTARTDARAKALEVEGLVEHRPPGENWRSLSVGEAIGIDEEVRSGPSSRARLQLGAQVTVELANETAINVAQLSERLSRVLLQDGRMVSDVRATEGFRFRVQVQGNNSQAEMTSGRFAVLRRGRESVAFVAEKGIVAVTGANKAVTLNEGEHTHVLDNDAPAKPTKLPSSLLLKLGTPPPSRLRTRHVQITGETSPGAIVTISNTVVTPNENGHFKGTVALVDGPNEIRVQVEDVAGRTESAKVASVVVDSSPPPVTGKVVW